MIKHGGNLCAAVEQYAIPLRDWLDLSTGINPRPWSVPAIPAVVWQRFPNSDNELLSAAHQYYGNKNVLALAGSQAAIQLLPFCRPQSRIGIITPCYEEHPYWWKKAGHQVIHLDAEDVEAQLPFVEVLLIINPNNPTTKKWSVATLLSWHRKLAARGGWLVVDEAFIDSTPALSVLATLPTEEPMPEGLIILRSVGKFFGLAGIRLGFIWASDQLLKTISDQQGPWAVSHPAQWVGISTLKDTVWQYQTRQFLARQSKQLYRLIIPYFSTAVFTHYFCYFQHPNAQQIQHHFAQHGILVRRFDHPAAIRLGLPANDMEFDRLRAALILLFQDEK